MSDAVDVYATGAAETLVAHARDYSGHELAYDDIREAQIAALNERLQQRIDHIKLLRLRAEDAGIGRIDRLEDVVPLLLPHTAYKSYPEKFLVNQRWDQMTKWLSTVSTAALDDVDLDGVADIDDWVDRLASHGHLISCSSGTTGNPALMLSTQADAEFSGDDAARAMFWGSDIQPVRDRRMFALAMVTSTPRGNVLGSRLGATFCDPGKSHFGFPIPPITIGSMTRMIALRKKMVDGVATPSEIAAYDEESAAREKLIAEAIEQSAEAIIAARGDKLHITGMWGVLHPVAAAVRARGYSGKDFHPENSMFQAGGLKRAKLPDDYREVVLETFNLSPRFTYFMYGMQELQTAMPRCKEGGRYHIPPWLVCLPLDKSGEQLLPGVGDGVVEGRAAFFDLSMEGRWGGVISGDHVHVDYGPCSCGSRSPSIRDDIYRYADIAGDDKIACSGTIDAYVRGMS